MKSILFSYFGLKIFSFLEGLDLIVKILWWLGFLTLVSLDPFIKGSPPTFSTHQQEKYLVYFIPLLPSLCKSGCSLLFLLSLFTFDYQFYPNASAISLL